MIDGWEEKGGKWCDMLPSGSSTHLGGMDLQKVKYDINVDAGSKAKYKLAHTKERDPISPDKFPGRELRSFSQASQSSELLMHIQEAWMYCLAQH